MVFILNNALSQALLVVVLYRPQLWNFNVGKGRRLDVVLYVAIEYGALEPG